MKGILICNLFLIVFHASFAQNSDVVPVPTVWQQAWQDDEFYLFLHFGPNTFTGLEWGHGTEQPEIFDPKYLDCEQWCRIAKQAGARGMIITAKHHDGFCLWPSKYSTHTVRESQWKNGKGDVLRELSDACKKYGLRFGVYLSPWDRNHPDYGTPAYNDVFVNMLTEIFENYGPIWELWWDGANGEGPGGKKQKYDFARYEKVVRRLSPGTIIFSDIGPDARWCGNEKGFAGETNWNMLDTAGYTRGAGAPSTMILNEGQIDGEHWIPAECDVSIRPGWFYHGREDSLVKDAEQLFDIYLKSVGRGANLLLNVPPDTKGLIHDADSAALIQFSNLLSRNFGAGTRIPGAFYLTRNGNKLYIESAGSDSINLATLADSTEYIEMILDKPGKVNCIVLEEYLQDGQHCARFHLTLKDADHHITREITATTIGHKRILTFPASEARYVQLRITRQKQPSTIRNMRVYHIDEKLLCQ